MRRQECGSNAMVTVQMTVEEYLEMKSRQETKSRLHFCRHPRLDRGSSFPRHHARPDRASLTRRIYRRTPSPPDTPRVLLFIFSCFAFETFFTGISPSLLTAESFLFSDARKSSNCPMCKCVFVLICKCMNVFLCVCLCANTFVFVCLNVPVCVYVKVRDYACANV